VARVVQWFPNLIIMLVREDIEVHLHAFQTMTEQFQLCEWGYCLFGKLYRCSKITSGLWVAPDYSAVHALPCSNSAMKGNNGTNRILYHDIAAQTITEPPLCFIFGRGYSRL
jgi:hypothetical protein